MQLSGQIALVTGGARGIGRAIAQGLAREGASVIVADIDLKGAQETARQIQGRAMSLDVSDPESVKKLFEAIQRLDILVNNAGITRDSLIIRMKEEDWEAVIGVNLKGVFLCSKEAIRLMLKQKYGRIINISSVVAFTGNPGQANYTASKAGILGFTRTVAKEYAQRGITVNAVAPGFIATAMTEALPEEIKKNIKDSIPVGRFGSVEEVCRAVLFFASPEAGYITGQVLHVNGGMYM